MNTYYRSPVLIRTSPFYAGPSARFASPGFEALYAAALAETLAPAADRIPLDLLEEKGAYVVRAEVPGVKRESIKLELQEGVLALAVNESGESDASVRSRTVKLPGLVLADKVEAKLEDGILTVRLPKQPETVPSKVTVTIN